MTIIHALAHQLAQGDLVLLIVLLMAALWIGSTLVRLLAAEHFQRQAAAVARFAWQFGVLLGLEQAYEFTRARLPQQTDVALLDSYKVLDLEWQHGFFIESRVERFFLQFHLLMNAVDLFYVFCHLIVTIGVLLWIYIRRREHFPFVRDLLMVTTAIALVAFYVYPAAPPRMLPNYGFVDPMQLHHLVSAGGAQPDSYTYNPYAAMPSLHVGYALVVALGLIVAERRFLVRTLAVLYPITMSAVVIISANHFVLDVVGAAITVLLALFILAVISWSRIGARVALARMTSSWRNMCAQSAD